MLRFLPLVLAAGACLGPALAQTGPAPRGEGARPGETRPADPKAPRPTPRRPSSLDELFERLAASKDEAEAKGIANLIERRWARSGSDTADLLMSRAGEALGGDDAALAIELLDRATQLKPDCAEAWHRRAAAFYRLEDPVDALADLNRALTYEPRHFNAWMALGHVRMAAGDKRRALEAYRKALALHPHLEDVKRIVDRIAPDIDGRDL